jgi:carbon storage regulator CsrA
MLIITRRIGETIIIAGLGSVTVTAAKGSRVRLGIKTAPEVPVYRAEAPPRRPATPGGLPKLRDP